MPPKQEQEPASSEVDEVAPGVLRMQLPIRMPGLGHVNMYALLDERGAAVVDPGLPGRPTWNTIRERLARAGLRVRDVHTVIVTHSHPDHFGGAARLARESGAEVVAHERFRFGAVRPAHEPEVSVEDLPTGSTREGEAAPASRSGSDALFRRWRVRTPWGGESPRPSLKMRLRWRWMRARGHDPVPPITRPVAQGDVLRLCGREFTVLHTPGHTEDHLCLHDPEGGLFLAGDHVLPSITPHISGLSSEQDPLECFFDSLARVGALTPVSLALPAHGHPFDDLGGRTRAIVKHHLERLEKVKAIGRELGPAPVEAFSQRLFRPRSWGAMAESETFAHLEHLRLAGEAARGRGGDGRYLYETG